MPDSEVGVIRDLIYYQYAKLIARSAFALSDGRAAKGSHYGFIKNTFRDLKAGRKNWSDILREDRQLVESDKNCAYCDAGASDVKLTWEHLVPRSLRISDRCMNCETILGIHNQVRACKSCNSSKGALGLYEFYRTRFPAQRKFYDSIPSLLEKKYLKTIYCCHECAGTIDQGDLDGDGQLTVLDLDAILRR